ncbi:IclR family transcriptional regulator [Rhodococcus sp. (in: high G+C Gram-positive bacteria)]|uniref:IclR family transcriptional regulator n=1 Tax=Rhodococcus sp. TaxID=1831 RepID=UPI00257BFD7D|nr:IclR family transcriptional regulator [Rhodococcus sp. (in: high G+C Gram-positive bacteria)]MBQ7803106.1 IclR family transcriptional regulator [Rhodococcus sp. (in: high G+C Gram-positive bacteria)]
MAIRDESPNAVIDRVVAVLSAFSGATTLTSSRIARRTGLPRSSVHRLLQQLVDLGVVTRDGFDYQVGVKLYELGSAAVTQHSVHRVAMPHMARLSRITGMSVYLATLSGSDVVYIDNVWTDWATPLRRGIVHPAHMTASGKMLLACLAPERRPGIDFSGIHAKTRHSIRSRIELDRALTAIRNSGVAMNREEFLLGSTSLAVQIGPPEDASTALSVWGPSEFVQQPGIEMHLRQTGRAIWRAAQRGPTRRPTSTRAGNQKSEQNQYSGSMSEDELRGR